METTHPTEKQGKLERPTFEPEKKSWRDLLNEVKLLESHIDQLNDDIEEYFDGLEAQTQENDLPPAIQEKLLLLQSINEQVVQLTKEAKQAIQKELGVETESDETPEEEEIKKQKKLLEQNEEEAIKDDDDDDDDEENSVHLVDEFYESIAADAEEYGKNREHTEKIAGRVSVAFRWDKNTGGFSLFFTDPSFKEMLAQKGIRDASIPISTRFEDYDDIREYAHTLISNNSDIDPLALFQQLSIYSRDRIVADKDGKQMNKRIEVRAIPEPGIENYKSYFTIDGVHCILQYNVSKGSFEIVLPDIKITSESQKQGIAENALTLHTENDVDANPYIEELRKIITQSGKDRNMYTVFLQLQQYIKEHSLLN